MSKMQTECEVTDYKDSQRLVLSRDGVIIEIRFATRFSNAKPENCEVGESASFIPVSLGDFLIVVTKHNIDVRYAELDNADAIEQFRLCMWRAGIDHKILKGVIPADIDTSSCCEDGSDSHQVVTVIDDETVGIDKCFADIVKALNAGGIATRSCCCGHPRNARRFATGGRAVPYIELEDGRGIVMQWISKKDNANG